MVANLSRPGGGSEHSYDFFRARVRHEDFELYLGEEIDGVLRPTIYFGMALLAAVAAHFGDGDAFHADADEGFLYLLQLMGLDDRLNLFHMVSILASLRTRSRGWHPRDNPRSQTRGYPSLPVRPLS